MRYTLTIRSIVFAAVFTAVMSISFLVEAHDVPEGTSASAAERDELYGPPMPVAEPFPTVDVKDGYASWYGGYFHGRLTASGRRYDMNELTAAHKSLPFGTLIRVVNEENGEAVVVEVTDRGPFVAKRVIDLSKAAARIIGVGVSKVSLDGLTPETLAVFYEENARSVVTITPDMNILVRPEGTLAKERSVGTYSKAMRLVSDDGVVVVRLNEQGEFTYSVAKSSVPVLALLD